LFELAQDYLKAGLFDRAENLLLELAEAHQHNQPALEHLLQIYEQEKEWDKAVTVCRKLARVSGKRQEQRLAQYYCEMAEQALERADRKQAQALARQALMTDRDCVRATLLLGRVAAQDGDHRAAIATWQRVAVQNPAYLGEVVGKMVESYRALDDETGLYNYLTRLAERHADATVMLPLVDIIRRRDGDEQAHRFLSDWLRDHSSTRGLQRLVELKKASSGDNDPELDVLARVIAELVDRQGGYTCERCGFRAKAMHWQCPGCRSWGTVKAAQDSVVG
jgi:lipopolysaccharide biosynthesis regulator YciM